jgi:hypothetical protein
MMLYKKHWTWGCRWTRTFIGSGSKNGTGSSPIYGSMAQKWDASECTSLPK